MKRLLRIGFDIFITSFTPIVSWLFIGIIIDKNLTNIFSLTYPLQCILGVIISIFSIGANVSVYKDNNKHAADNGIIYGGLTSIIVFSFIMLHCKNYINFMNMDENIYLVFCNYSIYLFILQSILHLVLNKLYYLEQNQKANKISLLFNTTNFIVLIITALITKNQIIITTITLGVLTIFDLILLWKNIEKVDFKLNLKNCLKYDSVSCSISLMYFIIYFFGFSNSFSFGEKYISAITFATLVTDIQWDMVGAIKTVAKIDIVKNNFNYKTHAKNAMKFTLLLISSVLIMSTIMYPIYKPEFMIVSIFLLLHIVDFIITPLKNIKVCYLEIEYSAIKTTINTTIAYIIRAFISFLPTPFCTILGQLSSSIYEIIYVKFLYKKAQLQYISYYKTIYKK